MTSIVICLTIFFVIYSGVGLLMDSRRPRAATWNGSNAPVTRNALQAFSAQFSRWGLNKALLQNKSFKERLDTILVRSGHVFGWKAEDLLLVKEIGTLLLPFLMWQYHFREPVLLLAGLYMGYLLPELYVKAKAKTRQADIQRNLPGFVDLITLAIESGLDLIAAVERIVSKMKHNALRDELQILMQESRLGTPRKEALQHLSFRTNLQDVQALTSMIIQSEELGTSLATVLRSYTEDMRTRRILKAEEAAGQAPIKLLFPMMVFFFPIVFVIIFGPVGLSLMKQWN
jgi:tight adherence protein C